MQTESKTMELVSVIIPNFNYARFLKQRIDTVLNQTYKNIEIIILDDCSTDNSHEVIEQYRSNEKVKHIVYNKENSGSTFKQWQKGFELAKGDFIWIAEADDFAEDTLLEKLMNVMNDNPQIKLGFVNSFWELPDKTFINQDYTIPEKIRYYDGKEFVRSHLLKENYIYNASMAVFRRDALFQLSNNYMTFRSCGDKVFWKGIALQGTVVFVCEALNHFRIHSEKVTTNAISSGLLFEEENRFYHMNIEDNTINNGLRLDVINYFLKYIENIKKDFVSEEAYNRSKSLWMKEKSFKNKSLPFLFRLICLFKK